MHVVASQLTIYMYSNVDSKKLNSVRLLRNEGRFFAFSECPVIKFERE